MVKADADCVRERGAHDIALITYTAFAGQHPADIGDFVLRSGVSPQATALGGMTTVHLAANKGYVELAEVLLAHGADVNAPAESRGQMVTPLEVAIKAKQEKMAEFLKSRGGRA
jgi:ankyrin repeat protein